jgi:hypothetical protein
VAPLRDLAEELADAAALLIEAFDRRWPETLSGEIP